MSGFDVSKKIRTLDCDAEIVICSGYNENHIKKELVKYSIELYLTKPVQK